MEIVEVINGALQGISNFLTHFFNVIGGSLNPQAVEGLAAIFLISITYRIFSGGVTYNFNSKKKEDDEDEEEWVLVRRRRK